MCCKRSVDAVPRHPTQGSTDDTPSAQQRIHHGKSLLQRQPATIPQTLPQSYLKVPYTGSASLIHTDNHGKSCIVQGTAHRVLVACAVLSDHLKQQQQQEVRIHCCTVRIICMDCSPQWQSHCSACLKQLHEAQYGCLMANTHRTRSDTCNLLVASHVSSYGTATPACYYPAFA